MKKLILLPFLAVVVLFSGCGEDDGPLISNNEIEQMEAFATANGLNVTITDSGVRYEITTPGTGIPPIEGNVVTVEYTGFFMDGSIFDTSVGGDPFDYNYGIDPVIEGWEEAIGLLKEGSEATFIVPSYLAYGERGSLNGVIPPNTPIAFSVVIIDIDN